MKKYLLFLFFIASINSAFAENYEPLAIIQLPETSAHQLGVEFNEPYIEELSETKKSKKKFRSMTKKFGPLQLNFRLNPMRRNRQGLRFKLDIVESYKIFAQAKNVGDMFIGFKPDTDYNILGPDLRSKVYSTLRDVTSFRTTK